MSWLTDWLSGKPKPKPNNPKVGPNEQKYIDGSLLILDSTRAYSAFERGEEVVVDVFGLKVHFVDDHNSSLYMGAEGKYAAGMSPEGHIYVVGFCRNGTVCTSEQLIGHEFLHQVKREAEKQGIRYIEEPDRRKW